MEARAGVPRGQAHRTGLCVRVCLRARHRPLSIALDDGSQAAPGPGLSAHQLFRCLRGGFQLRSLERRDGDAELSARLVEATGRRSGREAQLFLCKHLFSEAPPPQACQGLGTSAYRSEVHVFCVLGLSGLRFPVSAALSVL